MHGKLTGWDDTIVALATPPGIGAIGVVRLSGDKAIRIANDLFPSKDLEKQGTHTMHVGVIKDADKELDEVVVSLYKAPRSYTGEDVVEISGHGSPFVLQQIIKRLSLSDQSRSKRRGRISYANLGINQLGSVYESLLAYSGFFAAEALIEVKAAEDPEGKEGTFWPSLTFDCAGVKCSRRIDGG